MSYVWREYLTPPKGTPTEDPCNACGEVMHEQDGYYTDGARVGVITPHGERSALVHDRCRFEYDFAQRGHSLFAHGVEWEIGHA